MREGRQESAGATVGTGVRAGVWTGACAAGAGTGACAAVGRSVRV